MAGPVEVVDGGFHGLDGEALRALRHGLGQGLRVRQIKAVGLRRRTCLERAAFNILFR